MGLLVGKAQVLIHKELNVACFMLNSSFAHKTLLMSVPLCSSTTQYMCFVWLSRSPLIPSSARQEKP